MHLNDPSQLQTFEVVGPHKIGNHGKPTTAGAYICAEYLYPDAGPAPHLCAVFKAIGNSSAEWAILFNSKGTIIGLESSHVESAYEWRSPEQQQAARDLIAAM